ncbi:hypothetical protein YC2023_122297 [Brassica napus]
MGPTSREYGRGWPINRGRSGRYKWFQSQVSHLGSNSRGILRLVVECNKGVAFYERGWSSRRMSDLSGSDSRYCLSEAKARRKEETSYHKQHKQFLKSTYGVQNKYKNLENLLKCEIERKVMLHIAYNYSDKATFNTFLSLRTKALDFIFSGCSGIGLVACGFAEKTPLPGSVRFGVNIIFLISGGVGWRRMSFLLCLVSCRGSSARPHPGCLV